MTDPALSLAKENRKSITKLEITTSVLSTKMDNLTTSLYRIETNHLAHISADIKTVTNDVKKLSIKTFKAISELKVSDAKQEPTNDLVRKSIELIVASVVGGGITIMIMNAWG